MIKPLLRTLPTLSGNIMLSCNLSDFVKVDNITHECQVRMANMLPIHSSKAQHKIEIGLLNSSYEFDIKKFYTKYSDIFYSSEFEFLKKDLTKIDKTQEQYARNTDFEFGCKRNLYQKNGTQFLFYAPIWCESYEDLPDMFSIKIRINNNFYEAHRTINVRIKNVNGSNTNYLDYYLKKYLDQIDGTCIYCLPKTGQATYYGVDVVRGGFAKSIDNIINKNYKLQSTINNFDAIINGGWKRNGLVMKQILPLAFEFNLNDILSDNDKIKFANATLHIEGAYVKDGVSLQFYDIDCDYTEFSQKVYMMDKETGIMDYVISNMNIMDMSFPALNDGYFEGYRYSNKLSPMYNRWKLKYSDDSNPYITNMSWAFSAPQGSAYKYKEFPESFKPINAICDRNNNVILPLGNAITNPDSPYYNDYALQQNYINIINNHAASWFNVISDIEEYTLHVIKNVNSIVPNTVYYIYDEENMSYDMVNDSGMEYIKYALTRPMKDPERVSSFNLYTRSSIYDFNDWVKVSDNKAYCKGILYDMSHIYNCDGEIPNIDFFNVFVRVRFNPVPQEDLPNIKTAKYTLFANDKYVSHKNCIVSNSIYTQLNDGMGVTTMSSLYLNEEGKNIYNKNELSFNSMFLENKEGKGDFIDLMNYGIDMYEVNRYYKLSEIISKLKDEDMKFNYDPESVFYNHVHSDHIIHGKEFLPVYRLNEIYDKHNQILFANDNQEHGDWVIDTLQFSQGTNFTKTEYDTITLKNLNKEVGEERMGVPLYIDADFISYYSLRSIIFDTMNKHGNDTTGAEWVDAYVGHLTQYEFNPILEYNDTPYAKNVFTRLDTCVGKRYGDFIPRSALKDDKDLIYVDSYNMNNVIKNWNDKHPDHEPIPYYTADAEYDYSVDEYFDILNGISDDVMKHMWVEAGEDPSSVDYHSLPSHMRCSSNNWNYVSLKASNKENLVIYNRAVNANGKYVNVPNDYADPEINDSYRYTFNPDYAAGYAEIGGNNYGFETLNDNNSYVFYAKILDTEHLHWYMSHLYNNFDLNADADDAINSLYIKKRMIINDYVDKNIFVKDQYLQLLDFYHPYVLLTDEERIDIIENGQRDIHTYKKVDNKYYGKQSYKEEDYDSTDFYYLDKDPYSPTYLEYLILEDYMKVMLIKGNAGIDVYYINNDGEFERTDYNTHTLYYIDVTQAKDSGNLYYEEFVKWIRNIKDTIVEDIVFNHHHGYWEFNETFNRWNDVDNLAGVIDQDDENTSTFKFEIYYKKRFIKLNNNLYNIMNVDGENGAIYKDLYLYRIYKAEEYPENMKYYYTEDTSLIESCEEPTRCLLPLFDSVYMQDRENAVIYKEYNQSRVIPTTYAIWKGSAEAGIFCASSAEDVEMVTGQTAIQAYCPYHVHWFWYSGISVNGGIHTPTAFCNYYRYNTDNVSFMVDMSKADLFTGEKSPSGALLQEWPIKGTNILTGFPAYFYPSEYFDDEGNFLGDIGDLTPSEKIPYAYQVRTYDLINGCYSNTTLASQFINHNRQGIEYLGNNEYQTYTYVETQYLDYDAIGTYAIFGLNTYILDDVTYGFYLIDANIDNTAASVNIVDEQYLPKKYFTSVNGNNIYDNYNISDTFKMLLPMSNLTLTNTLYRNNVSLVKPSIYNIDCYYKQNPLYNENGEMYAYDITKNHNPYSIMSLERYFDSIVPYIKQTATIENAYNLKYKGMNATVSISYTNDVMYKDRINIYNYEPLRVYDINNNYEDFIPTEHKYFNDNVFVNLEEEFEVFVGDNLTYDDTIWYEKDKNVIKYFKNYINGKNKNSFNDDEILFLYNKYMVEYDSECKGLNLMLTEKVYTMKYKFKLK